MRSWKHILARFAGLGAAFALVSTAAVAQSAVSVSLGSVTAANNATVTIPLVFTGNGQSAGFNADINYDPAGISGIDLSACTAASNGIIKSCVFPGSGDHTGGVIRIVLAQSPGTALTNFNGQLVFTLNGTLPAATVKDLTWTALLASDPSATVNATNGKITIAGTAPTSTLAVTPASVNFGSVALPDMPKTSTLTARNSGTKNLLISSTGTTGGGGAISLVPPNTCNGTTLAPNATCTVTVQFNASAAGPYSGHVLFESDADNNPNPSIPVTGTATAPAPNFVFTGFNGNFGNGMPDMDPNTVTRSGSVRNNGSAEGAVSCTIIGPDAALFSLNPNPFPATLAPGASANFGVVFTMPGDAEVGDRYQAALSCGPEGADFYSEMSFDVGAAAVVAPIPTLQEWGLILLSLMMAGVAAVGIGRARKW